MIYPNDFQERCKELFPDWVKLHQLLLIGSPLVGDYLEDSYDVEIHPEKVLKMLDSGRAADLRSECQVDIDREALYFRWLDLKKQQKH